MASMAAAGGRFGLCKVNLMSDLYSRIAQLDPKYAGGAAAATIAGILFILARFGRPIRKSNPAMTLTVKWGREKLRVPLPTPDANLAALRAIVAEQTGIPLTSFKLIHAGAVMKDDSAPLSAYGLRSGSKIALIDGAANARTSVPTKEAAKPATEEATISVIREELASVNSWLVPALDVFLATIAPPTSAGSSSDADATSPSTTQSAPAPQPTIPPPPPPPSSHLPDIDMEHRRIGEELLQALLRLDVLNLEGSWDSARSERKSAVKAVQSLLERLDGGWRERKERLDSQQVQ